MQQLASHRHCAERIGSGWQSFQARRRELAVDTSVVLLNPKYSLPASCFAYVGGADDPHSWHLPYRLADGTIDAKRLPKAIQAILRNYRARG